MALADVFKSIAELATGAKSRQADEYRQFLAFYRELVETVPSDAVEMFGKLTIKAVVKGVTGDYGLLLTATDYIYWKQQIEDNGARFVSGVVNVQIAMFERLASKAEMQRLEPAARKALIALLEASTSPTK